MILLHKTLGFVSATFIKNAGDKKSIFSVIELMKHRHAKYYTENESVCSFHPAINPPVHIVLDPEVKSSVDRGASEAKAQPITRMFTAPRYSLRPRHWTKAAPQATWRRSRRCWWACTQRSPMVWRCRWHEVDSCAAATTPCTDGQKQSEPRIDAACMEKRRKHTAS